MKVQMFFYNETALPYISAIIPSILHVSIFRAEFAEFVFSFRLSERIWGVVGGDNCTSKVSDGWHSAYLNRS